ncbi:hypothetical protein C9374_013875 [Naegleria lovaniensis]|uniref:A20-type domain-containing protein n=1 Tax=Naegleria lovaniensis TaxID=51637 RepID=A0AA88GUT1_NAELO|nr:uncharacterized protein C9374_013875 [Naegleria lovaniensis]KAG2389315.1 hypothetical protein C9374_013875 [Naegleria lovaniensis]
MSQCKANCGFFGSDQFEGYCSSCYRTIVKKEIPQAKPQPPKYIPPSATFSDENEFQVLVKLIKQIKDITARKINTVLQTMEVYLTEKQARRLLNEIGRESLDGNNFIFHHAVYCRVVDRHHLQEGFGAEGYYHVDEGKTPPDHYKVWDHQESFLDRQ